MKEKPKYRIKIFELDSQGQERIIDVVDFPERKEADQFIKNKKAKPRPYKIERKPPDCFYELSAI